MKIASNKLSDLYEFYKSELSEIYDTEELYAVFGLVCEKYLQFSKSELRKNFETNINQSDLILIYDAAKALKTGLPVQYVLKEAFFYDSFFEVTSDVLIPRPETEELVDLVLRSELMSFKPLSMLDIGTGSGCIPVTLKKHLPEARVCAIDISDKALLVAEENARRHQAEVFFREIDVLEPSASFRLQELDTPFSVLISNPPYIARNEAAQMERHILAHEPHLALFVNDPDPIIFYKRIIDLCENALAPGGYLFFELNPLFAFDVKNYANSVNFFNFAELIADMSGKNRFLKARKK